MDFYWEKGYINEPETFFSFPQSLPPYSVAFKKPFGDGTFELITYPSAYTPANPLVRERYLSYPDNKTGYLVRWAHGDKKRKTVLCLHGYMLGEPKQAERMFKVRALFDRGLDVALFCAPFHWKRSDGSRASRHIALRPDDPAWTCEFFGQAMYDLQSVLFILKDLGALEIGIVGASLGGYLSALYSCLGSGISFAAMMVPAVTFAKPLGPAHFPMPFTMDPVLLEKSIRVLSLHSPLNLLPKLPLDKILIVASRGDRLCPMEYTYELCEKWGWPLHKFLTGGHWLVFNASERGRAWYKFLHAMGF